MWPVKCSETTFTGHPVNFKNKQSTYFSIDIMWLLPLQPPNFGRPHLTITESLSGLKSKSDFTITT